MTESERRENEKTIQDLLELLQAKNRLNLEQQRQLHGGRKWAN